MSTSDTNTCPTCGAEIPSAAPAGMCPKCMLGDALPAASAAGGDDATVPMESPPKLSRKAEAARERLADSPSPHDPKKGAQQFAPPIEDLAKLFPELEILELLGAGGMGAVYKARQPRLDRLVALKILSCPAEYHDNFALRFEREAQLLAKLNHPNIVTLYDFGELERSDEAEENNLFYFMMEFVDGADLSRLIHDGGLEPGQALRLVPQICDALQFAHDEGITHRDIKPANILVDKRGKVRIADFGLAKLIASEQEEAMMTGLTMTGTSMGTPHYMAPEQWDAPEKVDHRADIYSLGVVFYEMLTGTRPHGVFTPPSETAKVDDRIDTVVLKAMEKEPDLRYQQASQVKEDVTRVVSEPVVVAPASKSRKGLWVGICLAVVAVAVVVIWQQGFGPEKPGGFQDRDLDYPHKVPSLEENGGEEVQDSPATGISVPRVISGSLRGWGNSPLVTEILEKTAGNRDIVDVGLDPSSWVVLNRDGTTLSNRSEFNELSSIKSVDPRCRAVIHRDGQVIWRNEANNSPILPDKLKPVVKVAASLADTGKAVPPGLLLHEDGSLTVFAMRDPPSRHREQEEVWLARAKKAITGIEDAVDVDAWSQDLRGCIVRADGTVVVLDLGSESGVLTDQTAWKKLSRIRRVGVQSWGPTLGLTREGKVVAIVGSDKQIPTESSGITDIVVKAGHAVARTEAGRWMAWGSPVDGAELNAAINNLPSTPEIQFFAHRNYEDTGLVWIEPAENHPSSVTQTSDLNSLERVDLLAAVDPNVHKVGPNRWERGEEGFTSVSGRHGMLVPPVPVPSNYDLELRILPHQQMAVTLPVGSSYATVVLNKTISTPSLGGIEMIGGKSIADSTNETRFSPTPVVNGEENEVLLSVREKEDKTFLIEAFHEGKMLTSWEGDPSQLSTVPHWTLPEPNRIGLGASYVGEKRCTYLSAVLRPAEVIVPERNGTTVNEPSPDSERWIPGRLRADGTFLNGKPIDLSRVAEFDDIIDVQGASGAWIALRANGDVISSDGKSDAQNIARLGATNSNSSFVLIDRHGDLQFPDDQSPEYLPESLQDAVIVDAATAGSGNCLALTQDGRAIPWGSRYHKITGDPTDPKGYGSPQWPYPPSEALENVVGIAVAVSNGATVHKDGTLSVWNWSGLLDLKYPSELGKVRKIETHVDNILLEDDRGQVWVLRLPRNPTPNAVGGDSIAFTKLGKGKLGVFGLWVTEQGGWKTFNPSGVTLLQEMLDRHNLSEQTTMWGRAAKGWGGRDRETGFLLWIEPGSPTDETERILPPAWLFSTSKPGRVLGFQSPNAEKKSPLSLGDLESYDDFVQIRSSADVNTLDVIALRANGKVVSHGMHENWQSQIDALKKLPVPIRHLGYNFASIHHLVVIDENGRPHPMLPNHSANRDFPNPTEKIVDVQTAEGQSVMLTEKGKAILWGQNYREGVDSPWPMPEDDFLKGVAEIAVIADAFFLRRFDNTVVGWGAEGEIELPDVFRSGTIVEIAGKDVRLQGLDDRGRLWVTDFSGGLGLLENETEPSATSIETLKDQTLTALLCRDGDGNWVSPDRENVRSVFAPILTQAKQLQEMPPGSFNTGGHQQSNARYILWIEPDPKSQTNYSNVSGRLRARGTTYSGLPPKLSKAEKFDDIIDIGGRVGDWVVLRENGETISADGDADFTGIRKIAWSIGEKVVLIGQDGQLRFRDGSAPEWLDQVEGKDVVDIQLGNNHGLALTREGSAIAFGNRYDQQVDNPENPDGYGTPRWPSPPAGALQEVVDIAVSSTHAATLKSDGTLTVFYWEGVRVVPDDSRLGRIVEISSAGHFLLLLDDKGQVWKWDMPRNPFFDKKAKRNGDSLELRAPAGSAVLLRGESWKDSSGRWHTTKNPIQDWLKSEETAGAIFVTTYRGTRGSGGSEPYGSLLWIEPVKDEALRDSTAAASSPSLSRISGRLRAVGSTPGHDSPDLSKVDGISDIVDVAGRVGNWVALRANGQTISSRGQADFSGIRKIGWSFGRNYALIDNKGAIQYPPKVVDELPPEFGSVSLVDVKLGSDHGIALTGDGRALVFGKRYREQVGNPTDAGWYGTPKWPQPPGEVLTDVAAIAVTTTHAATVKRDGTLSIFGWEGVLDLKMPPNLAKIVDVECSEDQLNLLDANGRVWKLPLRRNPAPGQPVSGHGRMLAMSSKNEEVVALHGECWLEVTSGWRHMVGDVDSLLRETDLGRGAVPVVEGGVFEKNRFVSLLWIELSSRRSADSSATSNRSISSPTAPGRLRADGVSYFGNPFDLSKAEAIDDFVEVILDNMGWIGLREGGEVIHSQYDGFPKSGVERLLPGFHSWGMIEEEGKLTIIGRGPEEDGLNSGISRGVPVIPDDVQRIGVVDAKWNAGIAIARLRDGSARVWGERYERDFATEMQWQEPASEALKDVVDIALARGGCATLTADGTLHLWGPDFSQSELPQLAGKVVDLESGPSSIHVLLDDGRLFGFLSRYGRDGEQIAANIDQIAGNHILRRGADQWEYLHQSIDINPFLSRALEDVPLLSRRQFYADPRRPKKGAEPNAGVVWVEPAGD